jgi:hypothetical protein
MRIRFHELANAIWMMPLNGMTFNYRGWVTNLKRHFE